MLFGCRSHAGFREFLHTQLSRLALIDPSRLLFLSSSLVKLWVLNLDPAIPLLMPCYSSLGRPADFDPVDLLRSLLLMTDQKVSSITQWARILRNDRVLACLSGFDPQKTPSVGKRQILCVFCIMEDLSSRIRGYRCRNPLLGGGIDVEGEEREGEAA